MKTTQVYVLRILPALLIYALANANCAQVWRKTITIPDQKGKPTQTPTIRWVFQTFEGIDVLSIWVNSQRTIRQVLNLRPSPANHSTFRLSSQ